MSWRTTLTLDDDVAARLKELRRKSGLSLKQIVNRTLRIGLERLAESEPLEERDYRLAPVDLGAKAAVLDDVAEALSLHEREDWR